MSTKNYVLSVLVLLLVLTSVASALVINTPTTWTARTAIATQTDGFVRIDTGGSLTATARVDLNGVAAPGATKLILNGGTFTSPTTGADFCVHFPDNATGFPVYIVLNLGTADIAELRVNDAREARIEVGAGELTVRSGYNPYNYIQSPNGYYKPDGTFVVGTGSKNWLYPQPGFKLVVQELGGDDYKIYGVSSIYGENPTNNALVIDRELASVCFDSFDIEIAKVYFGPGDFNDLNYTPGDLPQLGSDITGLNPAGSLDTCVSLASETPLTYGKWSWAVEGYNAMPGDPEEPNELLQRRVFQFTVAKEPVVKVQPARQLVFGGDPATFTAEVDSFEEPTCKLYKVTPPIDTEISIGTVTPLGGFRYQLTKSLTNVQWADKGDYYFEATNSDGSTNTAVAGLKVKAELAHWAFEDNLNDTASKTYNTVVYNGTPSKTAVYVASSGLDTKALSFDGTSAGQYVDLPDGFDDFTGGMTYAVWANMDSTAAASVRYIDLAAAQASTADPLNAINMARGNSANLKSLLFRAGSGDNATVTFANTILTNTWQHFVATVSDTGAVQLYVNGMPTISNSVALLPVNVTRAQNYIGRTVSVFGTTTEPARFKGKIGDLRVYNYAITADDAATLYAASSGSFCRFQPDMDKIVNGGNNNCRVELAEFANFAKNWLDCGLFPVTACP